MKKRLFLTSSVCSVAHSIASKLDLTRNKKLVFIDTPAEPEKNMDISWLLDDRKSLVDNGFDVTDYTITGKNKKQLEDDLYVFDYIYVSGGSTLHLLKKSLESGFIDVVKDLILNAGKTYIGTSCGSIAASSRPLGYLLEKDEIKRLENFGGFGFVDFLILPHWGSEDFRESYLNKGLQLACREDQVPLILLTNTQYVYVEDDCVRIYDVDGE